MPADVFPQAVGGEYVSPVSRLVTLRTHNNSGAQSALVAQVASQSDATVLVHLVEPSVRFMQPQAAPQTVAQLTHVPLAQEGVSPMPH
jgi:hypothetical protein